MKVSNLEVFEVYDLKTHIVNADTIIHASRLDFRIHEDVDVSVNKILYCPDYAVEEESGNVLMYVNSEQAVFNEGEYYCTSIIVTKTYSAGNRSVNFRGKIKLTLSSDSEITLNNVMITSQGLVYSQKIGNILQIDSEGVFKWLI